MNKIKSENGGIQKQCLREMLREYLLQGKSYEDLANVIEEFNRSMSIKLRHLTPDGQTPQLKVN